jgi:hypothetical protein
MLFSMQKHGCLSCLKLASAFLLTLAAAAAQDAAPTAGTADQQAAYRSSVAQENVRKQTDKIQAEIAAMITELKLNGLEGADMAILTNASNHLRSLSQQDMQKVINALQSASMSSQAGDRQQSLVSAYQVQKDVSLQLKSLAANLAAQESQKEIPAQLENLIARQSANIRQTSVLKTVAVAQLDAQQKSTHDVVIAEQTSIGGEIDILFKVLSAAPAPTTDPAEGPDPSKAVLDALNSHGMKEVAQTATDATSAGPFPDAITKQNGVRDALTAVLRASLSGVDTASRLEQVKAQLTQIVEDQKDLTEVTQQSKLDGSILAERQAKIDDRTSVTAALLQPVSTTAFGQVQVAQQAMAQSSTSLQQAKTPSDSVPQEKTVVDDLVKAETLLDAQLAAAQKEEALAPTDKLAQLQQLQSEIQQAQQTAQPSAAQLQKLQQDATTPSPQAASKIADAADQMQKAQPAAAEAQKLLAQANADVQKQEDALKQEAQAYQALNQASQQLAQAQQDAAAANQAMQNPAKSDLTDAAKDLTKAQAAVDQAKQNPPQSGLPQDAQQALQQASDALKNATNQAVQNQGANAQAQGQQAMADMQKAQAALGQAMAQMQQQGQGQGQQAQPGQQGPPGQAQQSQSSQATADDAPQQGSALLGGMGVGGVGQIVGGLKPKDRAAITQYQAEKAPPEYAPQVQQYLKNLADSSSETDSH